MSENSDHRSDDTSKSRKINTMLDLFRDALVYERRARRITLRELARMIGCSRSTLSEFENGSMKTSADIIFRYAEAVDLEIFFSTKDDLRLIDPHSRIINVGETSYPSEVQ